MTPSDWMMSDMLDWQKLWLLGLPIVLLFAGVRELVKRWRRRL